ncbi:hypothetical protein LTR37_002691 [Vermiconidia calcicola]|uniref:Uncharacterized protein n=1 Tax=Vermiconidia calcicola TaxID=1690605 RepID=A0ACC3NSZ2_9PEZI|nr:hypothetical protein LTR37_002691 [Vermiconidia calcicola]
MVNDLQATVTQLKASCRHLDERLSVTYLENGGTPQRIAPHEDSHFTGPHHLIRSWPKIRRLLDEAHVDVHESYVLDLEERHRLPLGNLSFASSRRNSQLLQACNGDHFHPFLLHDTWFGHTARGYPSADSSKALLKAYVEHMHVLHPFIDLRHIKGLLKRLEDTSRHGMGSLSGSSRVTPQYSAAEDYTFSTVHPLDEAVVLLMLAIGAVCAEKAAMPPLVTNSTLGLTAGRDKSDQSTKCYRSASDQSRYTISPTQSGTPSPTDTPGPGPFSEGTLLYSKATQIMGPYADSNDLVNAQACLLAGLYKSQMGLVCDSMYWFHMAGRVCQVLLRQQGLLGRRGLAAHRVAQEQVREMQSRVKQPFHNLILLSTWTCIQLESDILAELQLVPSGVQEYENVIPWPIEIPGVEMYADFLSEQVHDHKHVLTFYTAQLWLRKRLNSIQRQLFGNAGLTLPLESLREHLRSHQDILAAWRSGLPAALQWDDSDSPASNILAARLRAKYLGACYLATRPFLDYVLHCLPEISETQDWRRSAVVTRNIADIRMLEAIESIFETDPSEVWRAARDCVRAAARSTLAFDGIQHHLIVTNIHGNLAICSFYLLLLIAVRRPVLYLMILTSKAW